MKKIISVLLILIITFSAVCVSVSAEGLYLQSDFSSLEAITKDFGLGAFYLDPSGSGLLYGYSEAKALQTHSGDAPTQWVTYDVSCEMSFGEDTMSGNGDRYISVVYCNVEMYNMGRFDQETYYMSFVYDIKGQQFWLCGNKLGFYAEDILAGPVPYELICDGTEFYTMGMSVSRGRIRCFIGDEMVIDYVDASDEKLIAFETPVPLVIWNDNNFIQIKDIKVASDGYLYPYTDNVTETSETEPVPTETTTQGGNEPTPTETTTQGGDEPVVTTTGKVENPADDPADDPADTDKPADTNKPADSNAGNTGNAGNQNTPADTNTNKPAGGSSTATGDTSFVVVAAMVAALGCALIVKKVSAE